jgi:hypothetical protein
MLSPFGNAGVEKYCLDLGLVLELQYVEQYLAVCFGRDVIGFPNEADFMVVFDHASGVDGYLQLLEVHTRVLVLTDNSSLVWM